MLANINLLENKDSKIKLMAQDLEYDCTILPRNCPFNCRYTLIKMFTFYQNMSSMPKHRPKNKIKLPKELKQDKQGRS